MRATTGAGTQWRQTLYLVVSILIYVHSNKSNGSHWIFFQMVTNHRPKISTPYCPEPLQGLHLISYIIRLCFTGPLSGVKSMGTRQHIHHRVSRIWTLLSLSTMTHLWDVVNHLTWFYIVITTFYHQTLHFIKSCSTGVDYES